MGMYSGRLIDKVEKVKAGTGPKVDRSIPVIFE
jgi:hypothetical protein